MALKLKLIEISPEYFFAEIRSNNNIIFAEYTFTCAEVEQEKKGEWVGTFYNDEVGDGFVCLDISNAQMTKSSYDVLARAVNKYREIEDSASKEETPEAKQKAVDGVESFSNGTVH